MSPEEAIDRLVAVLAPFEAIRLAVLFGSTARGEAKGSSDLDLGVLLAAGSPGDLLMRLEGAVGFALGREVDTVDLSSAPALLRLEIARDGRLLIERDEGAWPDFKARAMLDWWDWEPTHRMMAEVAREKMRQESA